LRAPVDTIPAPPFLTHLRWVNSKPVRMDRLRGKPLLVEFWDFCLQSSMHTLPYVKAWHERYVAEGLRVVGIHSPGSTPSRERRVVEAAVARLGITYPVLLDPDLEMWREYENRGWPARYLFDGQSRLFHYHYGEGAYTETELAIQELLGVKRKPLAPLLGADTYRVPASPRTYRTLIGLSSEGSSVSSSRSNMGGPSSSTNTAPPGQYGLSPGVSLRKYES
jgi:hypothetical protein